MTSWPGFIAPRNRPFRGSTLAACRISHEVFGVRRSKTNERSGRTVTRAGMGVPGMMCAVRALNSYINSSQPLIQLVAMAHGCRLFARGVFFFYYLAEIHALHTFATQCRTDGRAGTGLAGAHDQFDDLILGHCLARHGERCLESKLLLSTVPIELTRSQVGKNRQLVYPFRS